VLRATTPIITKLFLAWLAATYAYHRLTEEERQESTRKRPQGLGYGIGLAFALFAMQGMFIQFRFPLKFV
jgi:ATP-binding cassette subfamily C (CFTR/MRP) protein 1